MKGKSEHAFAMSQLVSKFLIGSQAIWVHIGNKDKFLQSGRSLLLLATGCYGSVKSTDLNSSSCYVVQTTINMNVHSWGEDILVR